MQIAEKYRKELREFNEGTLRLPAHAQSECKEEAERPTPEPETVQLKKIWTDEVDVVKGANKMNELEEGVQQNKNLNETSAGETFLYSVEQRLKTMKCGRAARSKTDTIVPGTSCLP